MTTEDEQILKAIPPSVTDYLHDIHGKLVEMRKLQERIADALERMVTEAEGYKG